MICANCGEPICFIDLSLGQSAIVSVLDFARFGNVRWHASRARRGQFYARRNDPERPRVGAIYLHRKILGALPTQQVDHRDRNGLNNCRCNLRICSAFQNSTNSVLRENKTGYRGVCVSSVGRFYALIKTGGTRRYLGIYAAAVDAARAYDAAARELHGEFATLNFPPAA